MYQFIKSLALPPFSLIALMLMGFALIMLGRKKSGHGLTWGSLAVLLALSTDYIGNTLIVFAQDYQALPPSQLITFDAEAIVILSAGVETAEPEFGRSISDSMSLTRLRYGAFVHQQTALPILISGGPINDNPESLASIMASDLDNFFGIQATWLEERASNTFENAAFSADILESAGISKVLLVTQAFHMRRAVDAFDATGVTVVPAPTGVTTPPLLKWHYFVPSMRGLSESYFALHELFGRLWYWIRYGNCVGEC